MTLPHADMKSLWMAALAYGLFSVCDALAKLVGTHVPMAQFLGVAHAAALIACVSIILIHRGPAALLSTNWLKPHILRGSASILGATSVLVALSVMPLANFYGFIFLSPLVVTIVSAVLFGERIDAKILSVIGLGLCGVLVVLAPAMHGFEWTHLAGLGVVASFVIMVSAGRRIGRHEYPPRFSLFVHIIQVMLWGCVIAVNGWTPVPAVTLVQMAVYGLCLSAAITLIAMAYAHAHTAARIAPVQYSQMIWGAAIGWFVFQEPITPPTIAGAGLVIASGLLLLHFRTKQPAAQKT